MIPVFDGHNDVLLRITQPDEPGWSFLVENTTGHLDLPRALRGGFGGGLFAVWVPPPEGIHRGDMLRRGGGYRVPMPPAVEHDHAMRLANREIANLYRLEAASKGGLRVVRDADTLDEAFASDALAAVIHFEGAEPIDRDLDALHVYYEAGLRSLGLVWSRPNAFATGVPLSYPGDPDEGDALTEAGRRLVQGCNELGVLVDVAHLNEAGFWDVLGITDRPIVSSHACAHAICPSARNLKDAQLDAIAECSGLVGVNFFVADVRPDGRFEKATPISMLVDQVSYLVDRMGVDHVALGSDFDGALMSEEWADAGALQAVIAGLQARFSVEEVRKIAHGNWLRVLREVW